ncbi:MAG: class A beta-lactamase [Candidatus Aminicenantes bacterium]|nr:class A beta-lactamase [Candidatus Aminicenantes bacterium]
MAVKRKKLFENTSGRRHFPSGRLRRLFVFLAVFSFGTGSAFVFPRQTQEAETVGNDSGLKFLGNEIVRLSKLADGVVGVGIIHLETGRELYVNGDVLFPMASTYKVPIAVQILSLVEEGKMSLDKMIPVTAEDCRGMGGTISEWLRPPGVSISVKNLLSLMLMISDNSATDINIGLAGGAEAVTERMRKIGIQNITVSRPTWTLIVDWLGLEVDPNKVYSHEELNAVYAALTAERREKSNEAFNKDPQDTATPQAMTDLLKRIWKGEILTKKHTELLLDIMKRCDTGKGRIRGILPPGTVVHDKTGTIGQTLNDVGYIVLPDNAGTVVISVYIKESNKDESVREKTIAQISRAAYDYFLFNPGAH